MGKLVRRIWSCKDYQQIFYRVWQIWRSCRSGVVGQTIWYRCGYGWGPCIGICRVGSVDEILFPQLFHVGVCRNFWGEYLSNWAKLLIKTNCYTTSTWFQDTIVDPLHKKIISGMGLVTLARLYQTPIYEVEYFHCFHEGFFWCSRQCNTPCEMYWNAPRYIFTSLYLVEDLKSSRIWSMVSY